LIGDGDDSGGVGGDDVYRGSIEPVLVSPSDSYSDDKISVDTSEPSSCPTLHHLLICIMILV